MPVTAAQKRAAKKYIQDRTDELKIRIGKGKKVILQAHAADQRESLNGFVNRAIDETVERDKKKGDEVYASS